MLERLGTTLEFKPPIPLTELLDHILRPAADTMHTSVTVNVGIAWHYVPAATKKTQLSHDGPFGKFHLPHLPGLKFQLATAGWQDTALEPLISRLYFIGLDERARIQLCHDEGDFMVALRAAYQTYQTQVAVQTETKR